MGTNYYFQQHHFEDTPNPHPKLHIGKSSGGWCFQLHIIPELGLGDWVDWHDYIRRSYDHHIADEHGEYVSIAELWYIVTQRRVKSRPQLSPALESDFLIGSHAEWGPNNLLRSRIGAGGCIGHGSGTWDLIAGAFS